MPWLILPPQPGGGPQYRVATGFAEDWPDAAAFRSYTGANVTGPAVAADRLPPTRNPEVAFDPDGLPGRFPVLAYDADGKMVPGPITELPDVLFGAGYSWFVSARVKHLLEQAAPGAVRLQPVSLGGPKNTDVPGEWYLAVFLQFADVIEEDRSNLLTVFENYANWTRPGSGRTPVLLARQGAARGLAVWSGTLTPRDAPCNAANVAFTYCDDAVMSRLKEDGITGFGPCLKIDLLPEGHEATCAPGSPRATTATARDADLGFRRLVFDVTHFGGGMARKEKEAFAASHPGTAPLRIPADAAFADLGLLDRTLIASEKAKGILEAEAPADVSFTPVHAVENKDGGLYQGPPLFASPPVHNMQPVASELSGGLAFGMLGSGGLSMQVASPDIVLDAPAVGDCQLWDGTPPGTGAPDFFVSERLYDALIAGGTTGISGSEAVRAVVPDHGASSGT